MKDIGIISIILVTVAITACAQEKDVDVYLIGGQSNATGQGYMANLPEGFQPDTNVLIFHSGKPALDSGAEPFCWHKLRQASESVDRFGPELGFGNQIQRLNQTRKIALIKHAKSDTDLFNQWNPGNSATDTLNQGEEFRMFVKTVNAGLDSLKRKGFNPIIRGMIWQQGEGDADHEKGIHSAEYAQNLSHFISRVREQFASPNMLFVYGFVYPPRGNEQTQPRINVRNGQAAVDENSGSAFATEGARIVKTDDLNHRADDPNTPYTWDHIHFGTQGILQLGIRMAEKMNELKK